MPAEANSEWFCEGGPESELDVNDFPSKGCSTHLQKLLYKIDYESSVIVKTP
jgi:hypothetical protein